jgi:signal transduction histidine kinase
LGGLAKELNRIPLIDEVLYSVAGILHTEMQLARVLIFLQDPLSGRFTLQAQCGLTAEQATAVDDIRDESATARWLTENRDTLVLDELDRRESPSVAQALRGEMGAVHAAACVPMILDEKLVGFLMLGEKVNQQMFFVTDIRLLENLAAEVALALKYRRLEDAIYRKNRLIELGTIAAGVAHEIRNPLASIRTFAQLLPHKMDDPEFTNDFSKLVLNDVDRITKVIESMLAFARPAQVTIAAHGAVDLVDEAIVLVQSRLKAKRIELTRQYHERPEVRVDKNQIMQVLVNLVNNAVDALPTDGKIRIAVGVQRLEAAADPELRGQYATIEVSDNGPGIPAVVRSRLFDPFFTTKKEGTGLGLSISQKIVRDHGGFISVTSVEGKGTSFHVNLPLS